MRFKDYPPQPPTKPVAVPYRDACVAGSFGIPFAEFSFGDEPHQSIAIYPAKKPCGPVLAFLHGGGWTNGYKETMAFMAPALHAHGITFASLGYRLAPEHVFPAGFEDCARGIALLHEKAAAFGADPSKLLLGGHSAGGHYAALLAVRGDWQAPLGLAADVIKGCLPISGTYRFGADSGLSTRPQFLGPEGTGSEERASPISNIQNLSPFLVGWGEKDSPHLIRQAQEFVQALTERGADAASVVLPGCDHFGASLAAGEAGGVWVPLAAEFAFRVTGRARP
jgi:acetyl esterase/lipase